MAKANVTAVKVIAYASCVGAALVLIGVGGILVRVAVDAPWACP